MRAGVAIMLIFLAIGVFTACEGADADLKNIFSNKEEVRYLETDEKASQDSNRIVKDPEPLPVARDPPKREAEPKIQCPDFPDVEMGYTNQAHYTDYFVDNPKAKKVNGWMLKGGYEIGTSYPCKKGSGVGENPNYWYCDYEGSFNIEPSRAVKYILNNDGSIKEILELDIEIVFDENRNYIGTRCKLI